MVKVLEKEVGAVGYGLMGSFMLSCLYLSLSLFVESEKKIDPLRTELKMNYE